MSAYSVDINCDMGESYGRFVVGRDVDIFPYISSCNIACGFHGGDPVVIERTIDLAIKNGVRIGAHPSYPDLHGFGRRFMDIDLTDLQSIIRYQVAAIKGLVEIKGGQLKYVKPHGALYNRIATDENTATAVYQAIYAFDSSLAVMGLAGTHTLRIANEVGITHIAEAFADRRYTPDGNLKSRSLSGAVITDPELAAEQVLNLVLRKQVVSDGGSEIPVDAQSICIHGDTATAVEIAQHIQTVLSENSIECKAG